MPRRNNQSGFGQVLILLLIATAIVTVLANAQNFKQFLNQSDVKGVFVTNEEYAKSTPVPTKAPESKLLGVIPVNDGEIQLGPFKIDTSKIPTFLLQKP